MAAVSSGYASGLVPAIGFGPSVRPDDDSAEYWSLAKCKRAYMDYVGSKREEISEQQSSRCYRHGAQWTQAQVEVLNRRKQPVVTYNRIGRKIDSIIGLMEKLKQDPKAYPRNPKVTDEVGAEIATGAVRYVIDGQLRERLFPFCFENGGVDGIGGVEMILVEGDKGEGDLDIAFALVKTDSFFYDPRSFDHDFEDARYHGQGKWMDLDDAQSAFPEHADALTGMVQSGSDLTSNPDREKRWFQTNPDFKRVRIVDIWYKHKGEWCWCLFTGAGKLEEGKGYFFNEKGEMISKYIMFSAFIDHAGDRYGFVRNLRSSQDEINQRRSKGLHELMSRRIKAEDGAFTDIEVARRESVRSDGVVIYNKGFEMEFDDQARQANIEGQLKFLEDAKNEIENFGPSPALIGQGLEYKSGRAINLLQQAGIAELGPFVVGIKNWKLRLYRAIWCAVQRYWTAERWIRVVNDEGVATAIHVNALEIDPVTNVPRMVNVLGQLDVNFILDEGPDEVNMMADAYDTLIALSSQGAKVPPEILIELAPVQASTKRKLLAILNRPDPTQEQAKQITLAQETAKVDEIKSKAAMNIAKAQETASGQATGIVERRMDMMRQAGEHQMRQAEAGAKLQAQQVSGALDARQKFMELRSNQIKHQQDIHADALKTMIKLRQSEEQHRQKMRMQAQRPASGGAA